MDLHWFPYGSGYRFFLNADPDPDPCSQTNADPDPGQVYLLILVHFLAPGSESAIPTLIRIRIQESQNKHGSNWIRIHNTALLRSIIHFDDEAFQRFLYNVINIFIRMFPPNYLIKSLRIINQFCGPRRNRTINAAKDNMPSVYTNHVFSTLLQKVTSVVRSPQAFMASNHGHLGTLHARFHGHIVAAFLAFL